MSFQASSYGALDLTSEREVGQRCGLNNLRFRDEVWRGFSGRGVALDRLMNSLDLKEGS